MKWPSYSSDLNPKEHTWDTLGRYASQGNHSFQNVQELKNASIEDWGNIPQGHLNSFVDSMNNRSKIALVLEVGIFLTERLIYYYLPSGKTFFRDSENFQSRHLFIFLQPHLLMWGDLYHFA